MCIGGNQTNAGGSGDASFDSEDDYQEHFGRPESPPQNHTPPSMSHAQGRGRGRGAVVVCVRVACGFSVLKDRARAKSDDGSLAAQLLARAKLAICTLDLDTNPFPTIQTQARMADAVIA